MEPKVSIIIPAFNVEKYIHKALESSIAQTYSNVEIIAVDDGSTDNTFAIIQQYSKMDSRIIPLHKTNGGVSSARNLGLDNCSGKYFLFLDADDWIEKNTVEILLDCAKKYTNTLICCQRNFVYTDGIDYHIERQGINEDSSDGLINIDDFKFSLFSGKYVLHNSGYKLYNIEFNQKLRFNEKIFHGEDGLFVYEYACKCDNVYYTSTPLWNTLFRDGSATMVPYNSKWLTMIDAAEIIYSKDEPPEIKEILLKYLITRIETVIYTALTSTSPLIYDDLNYARNKLKHYKHMYLSCNLTRKESIMFMLYVYCPFTILGALFKMKKQHGKNG